MLAYVLAVFIKSQYFFTFRHGPNHQFSPTEVNYRANILALKDLGVTHILAATACGSLKEEMPPGHFVILDSFIDRTTKRVQTYHTQVLLEFVGFKFVKVLVLTYTFHI